MTDFIIPPKPRKLKQKPTPPRKTKYAILPIRALTDPRLTDRNRTILAMLSSFASRAGITWVTQKRIGQEFKISAPAVNKVFSKLRDFGYITKLSGHKVGIKGSTYRVIFDPDISLDDAIAIAGNGMDEMPEAPPEQQLPQEDPVTNFRFNQPRAIGDIIKEIPVRKRKIAEAATEGEPQVVNEERFSATANDYTREFSLAVRSICGVERLPNEQDVRIASEFAEKQLPLEQWKQVLRESLIWHQQTGKQPPAGLGYYRQVALALTSAG
jgi:hypothetical protein